MSVRLLRCLSESGTVPPPGTVPPLEPLDSQPPFSTERKGWGGAQESHKSDMTSPKDAMPHSSVLALGHVFEAGMRSTLSKTAPQGRPKNALRVRCAAGIVCPPTSACSGPAKNGPPVSSVSLQDCRAESNRWNATKLLLEWAAPERSEGPNIDSFRRWIARPLIMARIQFRNLATNTIST
jgi:hypothetical protein